MTVRNRGGGSEAAVLLISKKRWNLVLLCLASFFTGLLFTNRMWIIHMNEAGVGQDVEGYSSNKMDENDLYEKEDNRRSNEEGSESNQDLQQVLLNKTISDLEMQLAAAKMAQESILQGHSSSANLKFNKRRKHRCFMVIGIHTAFNHNKLRDSIRTTWMPQGMQRQKLEEEKGIVIRFVIGRDATPGGILDTAIEVEERNYGDFMRLDHIEADLDLSEKTKTYFATAVSLWDAEFYVKVDDDVHVNIATLGSTLAKHRLKSRLYIGCMKSGSVIAQKGVKHREPEHWKFGGEGNKYFRHATGQLYAISRDLAIYISIYRNILHKYANEDVSLGSWFIGLDVEHIDDRQLCCGAPPECESKAQAGNTCVASFDWSCSGLCNSVDRMKEVHQRCGEGEKALWNAAF